MKKLLGFIMKISTLVLFFYAGISVSCSILAPKEEVLNPYIKRFSKDIAVDIMELDSVYVSFKSTGGNFGMSENTVGICFYASNVVYIDPTYWYEKTTTELQKVALIHHELGHCFCELGHDNKMRRDGCPSSLMASNVTSDVCIKRHWFDYIKKLKTRCKISRTTNLIEEMIDLYGDKE